jgi:hypothetical protein
MKKRAVVGLALGALLLAAPVSAYANAPALGASSQSELSVYMSKVKPHAVAYRLYLRQALSAIRNNLNYAKIRLSGQRIGTVVNKLQKIRAPSAMSEAHGSLVRGVRITGRALVRLVTDHNAGVDPIRALNKATAALDISDPLVQHWREEVEVQLRRAGLPVPLWVKNIG